MRSGAGQVLVQFGEEPLRLLQMRAVADIVDDHLAVAPARRRVTVQHRPGLRDHGLRRPGFGARPARDRADRAQVGQVIGAPPLRQAAGAPDLARRLGLRAR